MIAVFIGILISQDRNNIRFPFHLSSFDVSVSIIEPAFVRSEIFKKSAEKSLEILQDKFDEQSAPVHYERFFVNSAKKKEVPP